MWLVNTPLCFVALCMGTYPFSTLSPLLLLSILLISCVVNPHTIALTSLPLTQTVLTVKEYTLASNVRRAADSRLSSGPTTPNPDSTPTTSVIKDDEDVKDDVGVGIDLEAQKAVPSPDDEKEEEEEEKEGGIMMEASGGERLVAEKGSR